MYARQSPDPRFSGNMHVPHNYSGNAFRPKEKPLPPPIPISQPEKEIPEDVPVERPSDSETSSDIRTQASSAALPTFGQLFAKDGEGGIGAEELMILGLLLLVSQSNVKDDLPLFLILLLFLG